MSDLKADIAFAYIDKYIDCDKRVKLMVEAVLDNAAIIMSCKVGMLALNFHEDSVKPKLHLNLLWNAKEIENE